MPALPRWARLVFVALGVAAGIARVVVSGDVVGKVFGVVLIGLALSFLRTPPERPAP